MTDMIEREPRRLPLALLWAAALLASAAALDRPVAAWVERHAWDDKRTWSDAYLLANSEVKRLGTYPLTLCAAAVAALAHPQRWRAGGFVALVGIGTGVTVLLKWAAGRYRPVTGIDPFNFTPFPGGLLGAFHERNLCFPSGHACLAFATAAALAMLFPRRRAWFYVPPVVVGVQRVLENAHYVSDVVAGAALGVVAFRLTQALIDRAAARYERYGIVRVVPDVTVAR